MLKLALANFLTFDLRRKVFARAKTLKSIGRLRAIGVKLLLCAGKMLYYTHNYYLVHSI